MVVALYCIYSLGHWLAEVSAAPCRSSFYFCLCVPRVSYRALPSFHPGLGRSVALVGLFARFCLCLPRVSYRALPSFHLGYAGVSPLQGSLSYWAFAMLCRGIVFVKCVWVCKWIVAFVRIFVFV